MQRLEECLNGYGNSDFYGFHMPGHKRNTELMGDTLPYKIDITELEGFDDLHHANGILLEAERKAAQIFQADETHYLVNGSTCGNLSAVMACTKVGGKILVARNCHKSIYNGIYLQELIPAYIYPEFDHENQLNGEIQVADIERQLKKQPDIQAIVIVSPTYDGVVSDVEAIAQVAHAYDVPLIVDEAHGAHFGFHEYFPGNANTKGADIVIHSVHKTLPSMTQTALLHINGERVDKQKIRMYLRMFQSSSPSYVLMASIDSCLDLLARKGKEIFTQYVENLEYGREQLAAMKHLKLIETKHYDKSKIVISVKDANITSRELYSRLSAEYHLQMEMVTGTYVVGMTSIADTKDGFDRLIKALFSIDKSIESNEKKNNMLGELPRLELIYTSAEMGKHNKSEMKMEDGSFISTQYRYLYPPGIPIVVPGEKVTNELLKALKSYKNMGFSIEG